MGPPNESHRETRHRLWRSWDVWSCRTFVRCRTTRAVLLWTKKPTATTGLGERGLGLGFLWLGLAGKFWRMGIDGMEDFPSKKIRWCRWWLQTNLFIGGNMRGFFHLLIRTFRIRGCLPENFPSRNGCMIYGRKLRMWNPSKYAGFCHDSLGVWPKNIQIKTAT